MKKTVKIILSSLLCAILISVFSLCAFADADVITEKSDYIREKIIPVAVSVLSTLGALYIGVVPVISRVKHASEGFEKASREVELSNRNNLKAEENIDRCTARMNAISDKNEKELETIRKILLIGFCNNDELVKKGYAKEISCLLGEAGHNKDQKEKVNENDENKV